MALPGTGPTLRGRRPGSVFLMALSAVAGVPALLSPVPSASAGLTAVGVRWAPALWLLLGSGGGPRVRREVAVDLASWGRERECRATRRRLVLPSRAWVTRLAMRKTSNREIIVAGRLLRIVTVPALAAAIAVTMFAPPAADASPAAPTARAVARCVDADLVATTTKQHQKPGTADQFELPIIWTNVSGAPCTMGGFGGVDLLGPEVPGRPVSYSLPRETVTPRTLTLPPRGQAQSVITYVSGAGDAWTPTQMLITPPNETHSKRLTWNFGSVLRQDGATHPGTYLGPVIP